jgi:voltage-gated potassium channel
VGRLNLVEKRISRFLREPPSVRLAASVIVTAMAGVVLVAGLLMFLVDRDEYPTFGVAIWWALQTVTTIGYGDVTPTHAGGRIVAAAVMLEGVALIAIVTALITSTFVARASREYQESHPGGETDRELIARRLDEIERKLDRLAERGA